MRSVCAVVAVSLLAFAGAEDSRPRGGARVCEREWEPISVGRKHEWVGWYDDYYEVAASGNHVWAVGASQRKSRGRRVLVGHWDGSRWHRTQLPIRGRLWQVVASSPNEMWAVGTALKGGRIIVHGVGDSLEVEPAPLLGGFLYSLVMTGDGRLWFGTNRELLYVRTGPTWKRVPSGPFGWVIGVGPGGGLWSIGAGFGDAARVLRWQRGRWVRTPIPPLSEGQLNGITQVDHRSSYVWGSENWSQGAKQKAMVLRWTGKRWIRTLPPRLGRAPAIEDLAGRSPATLWARVHLGGTRYDADFLAARERGQWKRVPVPRRPPAGVSFSGNLAVAEDDLWVVNGSVARYACN